MVNWLSQFEEKAFVEKINQLEFNLETISHNIQETGEQNLLESCNRLRSISTFAKMKLANVDPLIIQPSILNEIDNFIINIITETTNYINGGNQAHLTNANNYADSLTLSLSKIPFQIAPSDIDGIRESVASFRRSAGQLIRHLESEYSNLEFEFSELKEKAQSITSEIDTQKGRLDTAISQFQQQFSEAEERRRSRSEETKEKIKEDNELVIDEIREKLESKIANFKDESEAVLDKVVQESISINEKVNAEAEQIIDKMGRFQDKAAELVTIITNSGMVGGYQEIANKDRRRATFWQTVAILSFIGLIVFAIVAFLETVHGGFEWGRFGARAFVAATFGILGAYGARQADKHDMSERKNRKMELELAAIDPYIFELPVETQHKIKEMLASRLFAQHEGSESPNMDSKTSGSVVDILKMAVEVINNLSKKNSA